MVEHPDNTIANVSWFVQGRISLERYLTTVTTKVAPTQWMVGRGRKTSV